MACGLRARLSFWIILVATMLVFAGLAVPVEAQTPTVKKVALVIANQDYIHLEKLRTPINDAGLVEEALTEVGFDVLPAPPDLTYDQAIALLRTFRDRADGADIALIYFAGHGVQSNGRNLFAVTDSPDNAETGAFDNGWLMMDDLANALADVGGLRMIVLDACRTDPSLSRMAQMVQQRQIVGTKPGLAAIDKTRGNTLIVYSAEAGTAAEDGDDRYSPFARAFARHVIKRGITVSEMLDRVKRDVVEATSRPNKDPQTPFNVGGMANGSPVYFQKAAFRERVNAMEEEGWQRAKAANTLSAYDEYLTDFDKDALHREEAIAAKDNLAWQIALAAGNKTAFDQYRTQNPKGAHWNEAEKLGDDDAWTRAQATGDPAASLETYLKEMPKGRHRGEAREKLIALRLATARTPPAAAETITLQPWKGEDYKSPNRLSGRDASKGLRIILTPGVYDDLTLPKKGDVIIEGQTLGGKGAIIRGYTPFDNGNNFWLKNVTVEGNVLIQHGSQVVMDGVRLTLDGRENLSLYHDLSTAGKDTPLMQGRASTLYFLGGQIVANTKEMSPISLHQGSEAVLASSSISLSLKKPAECYGGICIANSVIWLSDPGTHLSMLDNTLKTNADLVTLHKDPSATFMRTVIEVTDRKSPLSSIGGSLVALEGNTVRAPKGSSLAGWLGTKSADDFLSRNKAEVY